MQAIADELHFCGSGRIDQILQEVLNGVSPLHTEME